jgi:hypothetical protein
VTLVNITARLDDTVRDRLLPAVQAAAGALLMAHQQQAVAETGTIDDTPGLVEDAEALAWGHLLTAIANQASGLTVVTPDAVIAHEPLAPTCPDGATCQHECGQRGCFRAYSTAPLDGVYPDNKWPAAVVAEARERNRRAEGGDRG